jgi:hypothetical protein
MAEHIAHPEDSDEIRVSKRQRLDTDQPESALPAIMSAAQITTPALTTNGAEVILDASTSSALITTDTTLMHAESEVLTAQTACEYVAEQRESFEDRQETAKDAFDTEEKRLKDIFENAPYDRTGGRTVEEWREHASFYLAKLSEARFGYEMCYWSDMHMVALSFVNKNAVAARFHLLNAGIELHSWGDEGPEFPEDQEIELACRRSGDERFLQLCAPVFELEPQQQMLWLNRKKSLAQLTATTILQPRYKFEDRIPELVTTVESGTRMDSTASADIVHSHRIFCSYMLQRIVLHMVEGKGPREDSDAKTVLLDTPPSDAPVRTRSFEPRQGARIRPREFKDVASSRHHADRETGEELLTRKNINRMAVIVRYIGPNDKDHNVDAERVYEISRGLTQAFPEFEFPKREQHIMIRADNTTPRLIPSLWHDVEAEVRVSKHDFVFGDYTDDVWVNDEFNAYRRAEAFTEHLCGHFQVRQNGNFTGSCLIIGVDAMGCHWPRLMAFVQNLQASLKRPIDFFVQIKDKQGKMAKLCPSVVDGNRFGRLRSEDLLQYAFD